MTESVATPARLRVWLIRVVGGPGLADQPERFPEVWVHVHVKAVPGTFEVRTILVDSPWQIPFTAGELVSSGVG
mgnify:CR=1 FL=1